MIICDCLVVGYSLMDTDTTLRVCGIKWTDSEASCECVLVCACVRLQYFYSIKDISVGGQCICYGHARYCPMDPVTRVSHSLCDLYA